jgi:hypothetical protein
MKYIDSQNHTLEEIAALLRDAPCVFLTEQSRKKLANALEELSRYRSAAYQIRVTLASVDRDKEV